MKIKLGVSLILAFLAFVFITQNTESVRVVFIVWSTEISLVLLVFIALVVGIAIGWLSNSFLRYTRHRKQQKGQHEFQQKTALAAGAEIPESKKQPVADPKGDKSAQ